MFTTSCKLILRECGRQSCHVQFLRTTGTACASLQVLCLDSTLSPCYLLYLGLPLWTHSWCGFSYFLKFLLQTPLFYETLGKMQSNCNPSPCATRGQDHKMPPVQDKKCHFQFFRNQKWCFLAFWEAKRLCMVSSAPHRPSESLCSDHNIERVCVSVCVTFKAFTF